jgi:hypothetical protein
MNNTNNMNNNNILDLFNQQTQSDKKSEDLINNINNAYLSPQPAHSTRFNNIFQQMPNNINLNLQNKNNNNMNNNMNNMGMNNMGMNNNNNNLLNINRVHSTHNMNMNMNNNNMFNMNTMNNNMNFGMNNPSDPNLYRLKYLLGNIQQNLNFIMNDINEIGTILSSMKNEELDSNPNLFSFKANLNKYVNFFNNINQTNKISIIFRTGNSKPTMLECEQNEIVENVIKRFREASNNRDENLKFIFNARNINQKLTVAEAGLTHNANIYVVH